ncbi:XRE family transcriptional regulator [Mesonia sp. K7]|nr:XRE family transcriptional regulator [Mesonia sp. K7]
MDEELKKRTLLLLASRIKNVRVSKNITQEIAYNDTGIHFGRIEQGNRDISFTTLVKICSYLEIEPETLLKDLFPE